MNFSAAVARVLALSTLGIFGVCGSVIAQGELHGDTLSKYYTDGVNATLSSYDFDLLGDHVDLATGKFSAEHVDIDIPGNSALPVRLARRTGKDPLFSLYGEKVLFSDWIPNFPYINAKSWEDLEWRSDRCTGSPAGSLDVSSPAWDGFHIYTPNEGRRQILTPDRLGHPNLFESVELDYVTKDFWRIDCTSGASDGGEGFKATSPNGISYYFEAYRSILYKPFVRKSSSLSAHNPENYGASRNVILFASRIEDEHGNWVAYDYSDESKFGPTKIHSNDGREINLIYDAEGQLIISATAHGQTWEYKYDAPGPTPTRNEIVGSVAPFGLFSGIPTPSRGEDLYEVILPSGQKWEFEDLDLLTYLHNDPSNTTFCSALINSTALSTIKHPDGVEGRFEGVKSWLSFGRGGPPLTPPVYYPSLSVEHIPGGVILGHDIPFTIEGVDETGAPVTIEGHIRLPDQTVMATVNISTVQPPSTTEYYVGNINACEGNKEGAQSTNSSSYVSGLAAGASVRAITKRELHVPNGDILTWSYGSLEQIPHWEQNNPDQNKIDEFFPFQMYANKRSVTSPNGRVDVSYLSDHWAVLHGSLLRTDTYVDATAIEPIRSVKNYSENVSVVAGGAFLNGKTFHLRHTAQSNLLKREIVLKSPDAVGGTAVFEDTYTTEYDYDDTIATATWSLGRPIKVEEYNSIGAQTRVIETDYENLYSSWNIGLPEKVTINDREFSRYEYNAEGQVDKVYKFGDLYRTLLYHSSGNYAGRVSKIKQPFNGSATGKEAEFLNYYRGTPREVVLFDGQSIHRTIDDYGRVTSFENARGFTTSYQYNSVGWLTDIDRPAPWADTSITYQNLGTGTVQVVSQGDNKTTITNDGLHRPVLTKVEDLSGQASAIYTKITYDPNGKPNFHSLPSHSLDPTDGVITEYDALGRVIETRQNYAPYSVTAYDFLSGNKLSVTDPRGFETVTTYRTFANPVTSMHNPDEANLNLLPVMIEPPLGAHTELQYDIWGNLRFQRELSPVDASILATTEFQYTLRNQLQKTIDPAGDGSFIFYDLSDQPVVTIDGENRKTRTVYDEMGRVDKLIKAWVGSNAGTGELDCTVMRNAYSPSTGYLQQCYQDYTYDPNGNVSSVKDAKAHETTYTYNSLDLPDRVTFPDGSYTRVQAYDARGNPVTTRTRAGDIHTAKYDGLNRMVGMRTPDRDSAYAYNAQDLRTCASVYTSGALDLNAAMDCQSPTTNRLNQVINTYDAGGRLLSETSHLDGAPSLTTSYQYDAMNNRERITWPDNFYVSYEYDALGRLTDAKQNGTTHLGFYAYDTRNRLDSITYGGNNYVGGVGKSQTDYAWEVDNDLSNLTHRFDNSPDVGFTYGYDASGKLISEASTLTDWLYSPQYTYQTSYDPANDLNQYTSIDGETLSHDLNGNRTSFDGLDTPHDSENRLTGIGTDVSYSYDADGRRIAKSVNGIITRFVHAGDMEIAEYDGASLLRRYVPGHSVDQRLAMIEPDDTRHFYKANRLGSVQALASATGAVTDQYVYSPFGVEEPLVSTGNPFRFTGRRFDPESGLHFYRARYFDSEQGRFLQTDPIGYQDLQNLYTYVGNDPVNMVDPNGEDSISVQFKDQKIRPCTGCDPLPQWVSGGHSGIVIIRNDGYTKYREYGRYPGGRGASPGAVRAISISNIEYVDGVPTSESLTKVFTQLLAIGENAGSDDLRLDFNLNNDDFDHMMDRVDHWEDNVAYQAPHRTCHTFCEAVERAGKKDGDVFQFGGKFSRRLNPDNVDETVESVRDRYERHTDSD